MYLNMIFNVDNDFWFANIVKWGPILFVLMKWHVQCTKSYILSDKTHKTFQLENQKALGKLKSNYMSHNYIKQNG